MSLSRRVFAKLLPAAPVMANAAMAGVADQTKAAITLGDQVDYLRHDITDHLEAGRRAKSELERCQQMLAALDGKRGIAMQRAMRNVRALEPDLASARSFSLSARIRVQAERDVERAYQAKRETLLKDIAEMLGANKN